MKQAAEPVWIPDGTYAEQESLRFRIAARVRGILVYRLVNLFALPAVALLAWPSVQNPTLFLAALLAGVALNAAHLYLHFLDHPLSERWWQAAILDSVLYGTLAVLSGAVQSQFVYFFFPLILSSTVRFSRRSSWTAGGFAVSTLVVLHVLDAGAPGFAHVAVLALMFSAVAAAAAEMGDLVTATRDRSVEAVMALVGANKRVQAEQAANRERAEQVRLLLDSTEEGIFGVDIGGICTFVNPACLRMLGYEREQDLLGKNMHALIHHSWPDGSPYPKDQCRIRRATLDGVSVHSDQEVHWRADGSSFPVEYWAHPIRREGKLAGAVVTFVDITARLIADAQMRKLSSALEQTADAVSISDRNGIIEYVNPAFETVTGYRPDEAVGRSDDFLRSGQHDEAFYKQIRDTVMAGKVYRDVLVNRRKDGSLYYEEKTITPLKDSHGVVQHVVASGKDITERMENEQRLHYLAHHDLLTGLPNRALLTERLEHALTVLREENVLGVLFLDVDRFKVINDTLGHQAGDGLLRELGRRLEGCVRKGDTVARLGGDEFAILLEGALATDHLAAVAEKILHALERPFMVDGRQHFVTASIGICAAPMDGGDAQTLLKHADIAMYRSKDLGRNRYHFYSSELGNEVLRRLRLESRLREALESGQFRLHYQPQIDVRSGRIVGFEALLRWHSPDMGLVGPDQFIPILEETGLILPVGEWVLETACRQIMDWSEPGGELRIAVNVSSRQFGDPSLMDRIDRVLASSGLPANRLEIEITESTVMRDDPNTMRMFKELGKRHVRVAIDDFGTGYSSLSYLKRFPLDTLKIDRSFVRDIPQDSDDATIVQTIIAMARTLNLQVVAEGVETADQFTFLGAYGCDIVQGYLFSPPVPPDTVRDILTRDPPFKGSTALTAANDSVHTGTKGARIAAPRVWLCSR